MEILIFVIATFFILMMGLLGLSTRRFAIVALFGGIVGMTLTVTAQSDLTITISRTYDAASATWKTFTVDVYPAILMPLMFTIFDFMIGVYQLAKR